MSLFYLDLDCCAGKVLKFKLTIKNCCKTREKKVGYSRTFNTTNILDRLPRIHARKVRQIIDNYNKAETNRTTINNSNGNNKTE